MLAEKVRRLELINRIGLMLTSELELERVVQKVTDIATQVSGARFGAFFYRKVNDRGEEITLYSLSGAEKKDFSGMHSLRGTPLLAPTFAGHGPIRSDDITRDPRYGQSKPHYGMPKGHAHLRSYLALPVVSRGGEVLGGLFFGHPDEGVFTQYEEDLLLGVAAQAAVAIDNARLYEANLEAERRTRLVLESIPQMAWTSAPDGTLDYFNRRWHEYTGLSEEESRTSAWQSAVHPDDIGRALLAWESAVATGDTFETENRIRCAADGAYRWHLVRATAVRDREGSVAFWVGTCTNTDELKQVQHSLQKKNEALAQANEELDSFVYKASHDLKAPVGNIQMIIQQLHEHAKFGAEHAVHLEKLLHLSIDRLRQTIQDLSEIVRVQHSQLDAVEGVELAPIIEEVGASLAVLVEETGAKIITDLAEVPAIPFNRSNLKSILYNLIHNGIKYRAGERPPVVSVTAALEAEYIRLTVADNGMGMDLEKNRHRLFRMFTRFHGHVPGSGIGLYIVHRLLKNHGGHINVKSRVGEGTVFDLFFKRS